MELEEKAKVHVIIEVKVNASSAAIDDDPTGWKAIRDLIGSIEDAPPDMAENHDKYLYGDPHK